MDLGYRHGRRATSTFDLERSLGRHDSIFRPPFSFSSVMPTGFRLNLCHSETNVGIADTKEHVET
jgi:hypothetical protein